MSSNPHVRAAASAWLAAYHAALQRGLAEAAAQARADEALQHIVDGIARVADPSG